MNFLVGLLIIGVYSFLPGINRKKYSIGDIVEVYASTLTSDETQLPFNYYYLPYCSEENSKIDYENLGQALTGDIVGKTPYKISFDTPLNCKYLCNRALSSGQLRNFRWMIDHNYKAMWILDSLPSGLRISSTTTEQNLGIYEDGFPIGYKYDDKFYIYNHHHIIIKTHDEGDGTKNIVGFLVQPFSFLHSSEGLLCEMWSFKEFLKKSSNYTEELVKLNSKNKNILQQAKHYFLPMELDSNVTFSYSVAFEPSNVRWASRWDIYLYSSEGQVHWISIVNSFGLVLLLTLIVGNLFRRAVGSDIRSYNESADFDAEIDSGWKQLKGNVFRSPIYSGLFSIIIGSGVQVISMSVCTLIFACVGFLSPEHRGALLTTILILFAMTGILAGGVSGRLYKMFSGEYWKRNALGTAFIIPGIAFTIFFIVNILLISEESSSAVPFSSLIELLLIWFGISVPLTFLGSALGYKHPALVNPSKVSRIPRPLPMKSSKMIYGLMGLCGSLPFGSMLIELNYIMKSIWHHTMFYYLFGFLFLCFILVAAVSCEISILIVYVHLCQDDYRWWWPSLLAPGSSGIYLAVYAVYYYFFDLSITRFSSIVLYFGYMAIGAMLFSLVTGAVGFLASFVFVRKIYSVIKLE